MKRLAKERNLNILVFSYTTYYSIVRVFKNFGDWLYIAVEKSVLDFYEKEIEQIKEMISKRMLILCNTMQQLKPNVCTNIQNPRSYSS